MRQLIQLGSFGTENLGILNTLLRSSIGVTTGNVYYCDPVSGLDVNDGLSPAGAVKTLAAGYALMTSGNNDVLVLIGNGTSTGSARISSTFTWSKNAAHLIGMCAPSFISQRARIAPPSAAATAAFANLFVISGSGCLFQNVSWFHGFGTGVAAEICVTITGLRNAFINCDFEGMGDATGAADAGSRSLLIQTGGENYFSHCNVGLDTIARTNANASVEIKAAGCPRNIFEDCLFPFLSGDGASLGILIAAGNVDRFQLFRRCTFINAIQSGATAIATLVSQPGSQGGLILLENCVALGVTEWGDTGSDTQCYVAGPAVSSSMGLAVNPAT